MLGALPDISMISRPTEPFYSPEVEDISGGNLPADFHPDLLSFITICQHHKIDIWPLYWDIKLDMLGKGATGDVRQAIIDLESQFAFKRFISHRATRPNNGELPKLSTYNSNEKLFTSLVSEVVILNQPEIRRHEHIVNIAGIAFDVEGSSPDSLEIWPLLIMSKAQHGNLMNFLASERGRMLDFLIRLEFCAQIGSAISTMHSNNIVHGDIKPQNILIYEKDQTLIAKVTDFSYSCLGKSEEDIVTMPRSELWQAPEYSREGCKIRDAKLMDIYSFGMVCFWLLFPSEFGDLASTREALSEVQAKAENLASKRTLAESFDSKSLGKFFASTLCTDPQARNNDWRELVTFLGQRLWQPENEDNYFDGTRRLTLADYSATVDDIKDPKKLEALTSRILNSLSLTGTDYDIMRKHLDSTKFTNEQRTEWYIDKVLEGLSKFSFPSAEKDDEIRTQLKHSCLNLSSAFFQLIILDYRVRIYVVQCLEQRANGSCEQCAKATAFELAFCYTLGFGVMSNTMTAQTWLTRSGSTTDQLGERLEYLRNLTISDIETTTHARSGIKGNFAISHNVRYGSENFQSAEIHLSREIQDLEKYLGIDNWQLFELKFELIHLIWAQNKAKQATVMAEAYRISIQRRYGTEHMLHIRIMLVLADLYGEQGVWDDAEKLLLQSKRILVENIGLRHHLTLQTCASLASTYVERGKIIEAEEEFKQIFNTIQERLHLHHPISSEVTQRYAKFLERQGKITDASVLRAQYNSGSLVSHNLKRLFENHNNGRDARLRGDLDLAENMLSSVKREAEWFVESHDVPDCREYMKVAMMATRNLALVIRDKKRFEEAETLQRELKGKLENELGAYDRETLNVTFDLARTLQIQEKWAEAERLQLAVKSGREALLSRTNEDTIISSRRLAEIYERQDKIDEAENERKWVRDACMECFGPCHKDSIEATEKLALIYLQRGKLELAEEACLETALLYEDSLGPNDANALGFRSNLGAVYIGQGRLQEATELLEQTLEKMRNHLPREHQFINITKNHLANAYIRQGKIEEVGKLGMLIQLPGAQQQAQMRVLSEDEQLQQAIQLSLRTEPGEQSARGGSEEDEDLQRAIAMSLE
ncbi:hypothetical protein F4860DRAFT_287009 [Xylaria cubensis]|nr:hypothetical protein F4860DRAFT_287009 [Xylaria cubensis]